MHSGGTIQEGAGESFGTRRAGAVWVNPGGWGVGWVGGGGGGEGGAGSNGRPGVKGGGGGWGGGGGGGVKG